MNTLFDDLRAALYSIWHRRHIALAVAWAVCLAGWLLVAMIPNSYEAQARIFVQMYDPLGTQAGIDDSQRRHQIDNVRQTLTSSLHLEKVIRSTRLGQGISSRSQMDAAIAGLGKSIKVTSDQDNLFQISASSSAMGISDRDSARLSLDIVQKMIDIFRDENMNANLGEMRQTLDFIDQQLTNRSKELEAAEQRRQVFESKHPELAQGGVGLVQRLEQGRAQMRGLDGDIIAAQSSLAAIQGQLAATPATVAGAPGAVGGSRGQLAALQAQLASLKAQGMTDQHPDVISLHNQISAAKAQVAADGPVAGPAGVQNPAYATLVSIRAERQATLQALQARRAAVEADVAQAAAAQNADPQLLLEAQNISRDYDVLKGQYDKMVQDREELRLRGQVQSQHGSIKFTVIDPPTLPRGPSAPNRPMLLFAVLIAGLLCGVGAAFAVGELRSTFATTAKLERALGMPVLGAISRSVSAAGKLERGRQIRRFGLALGVLMGFYVVLVAMEYIQRTGVA